MTKAEERRALALVAADSRIRSLLAGRDYHVPSRDGIRSIGPWHTSKDLRKLGAALEIAWREPLSAEMEWPVIRYDEEERTDPPYREHAIRCKASGVRSLMINVDFERHKVVSIWPGLEARVKCSLARVDPSAVVKILSGQGE